MINIIYYIIFASIFNKNTCKYTSKDYNLIMNTSAHEKFASHLRAGRVYRRRELLHLSKTTDRDLILLTNSGFLEKVGAGLYYKPAKSLFGTLPPDAKELVGSFLKNDDFLLYSWNQYNALGVGLTQLYNQPIVYNRKRHGLFKLGNKTFDFRRPLRGFPKKISPEFLLVDLVNNLDELTEDTDLVKRLIKEKLNKFNLKKLLSYAQKYGKVGSRYFFENLAKETSREIAYE